MTQTPMQELIEWVWKQRESTSSKDAISALDTVYQHIEKVMIEKEKEVIMDAHHCGRAFENKYPESVKHYNESAELYYNETFNTEEK